MVDILDEETYIKNILENGFDPESWRRDFILLTKYKKSLGEKKKVAKEELLQKCEMYVAGYDDIRSYKYVNSIFNKTWREWKVDRDNPENSSKFRTIRSVEFTKEAWEWFLHLDETFEISDERVDELRKFRYDIIKSKNITNFPFSGDRSDRAKILFTMFIWEKIQSQYTLGSDWVQRKEISKFKKQANLRDSCNVINEVQFLSDLGFLRMSENKCNIQATFLQKYDVFKIPVTDENRMVITGDELYEAGFFFDKIKFGFYECQECHKKVIIYRKTAGKPPKYCKSCAKLVKNHTKKEYFCECCGKPIEHDSQTKRIIKYCRDCAAMIKNEQNKKYIKAKKN